jgi:hypothetical protein
MLVAFATSAFSAVRTVAKDGTGAYRTIQAALDASQPGDEIVIKDAAIYEEQVTINKNRIVLRSENAAIPNAKKPTIKWQDRVNVNPKTKEEALQDGAINFDQNGALRVMRAIGVRIEGIIVDGGGAYPFGWAGVWFDKLQYQYFPLFHGNAAITLWIAGDVTIRYCETRNAFFGIAVKDRNEGGIFANANPADIAVWRVVPFSGFGKTGNHLIEHNRIHHNSYGVYFESTWDLGSVIRYNLIYDNHHSSKEFEATVKALPGGADHTNGAAFLTKDHLLSPLAIYNNTFYHNGLMFAGIWRSGNQHLIFNNIYGPPYALMQDWHEMSKTMPNRMYNSLYAAQASTIGYQTQTVQWGLQDTALRTYVEKKDTIRFVNQVRVLNDFPELEKSTLEVPITISLSYGDTTKIERLQGAILPGALLVSTVANRPFPREANMRWLEVKFQSVDPTNPNFLVPDWEDENNKKFIIDQGWAKAGIYDSDGSIADIGAIPYVKKQETAASIKPLVPVIIRGTTASVSFNLSSDAGAFNNPKVKFIRWVNNVPFVANAFAANTDLVPVPNSQMIEPTITTPIQVGFNRISWTVPERTPLQYYGFLEMVIEGVDAQGNKVTSNVGFLPYRQLGYIFDVIVTDQSGKQLNTVRVGEVVKLKLKPLKIVNTSTEKLSGIIDTTEISLQYGRTLLNDKYQPLSIPKNWKDSVVTDVIFTKIPVGGFEYVSAAGKFYENTNDTIAKAINGVSEPGIRILPGLPDSIVFQDPASKTSKIINPGITDSVKVAVYDRFGNNVDTQVDVTLTSLDTKIAIDGSATVKTNDSGYAYFKVKVIDGKENDSVKIIATLNANKKDTAFIKIGRPKDKFYIFFTDGALDSTKFIDGFSDTRYPVTVIASSNGKDITTTDENSTIPFTIDFGSFPIVAYGSNLATDKTVITGSKLTGGKVTFYLTGRSAADSVRNGTITILPSNGSNTIVKANRDKINLKVRYTPIDSAAYFSTTPNGTVNRLEIFYKDSITPDRLPDSLKLTWPNIQGEKRVVNPINGSMTIDNANKRRLIVTLPGPFAAGITGIPGAAAFGEMGIVYRFNQENPFMIKDRVGPLLDEATLIERISETGNDTLYIKFTENTTALTIRNKSLKLIKNNGADTIVLNVLDVTESGSPNSFRIVVENQGRNSPAENDKLMINGDNPITDTHGNKANKDNRPIVIKMKKVPPSIAEATYYDLNADGRIDRIQIIFNKTVDKSKVSVWAEWTSDNVRFKDTLRDASISFGENQKIINVAIAVDGFTSSVIRTSGTLSVVAKNSDFPGEEARANAADKAAPVLTLATFNPGIKLSEQDIRPDTLLVEFSEPVKEHSTANNSYFNFYQGGTLYTMIQTSPSFNSDKVMYFITGFNSSIERFYPKTGDSVNIIATVPDVKIIDVSGNSQDVETNRKILMKVNPIPYSLEVRVGPNPFNPNNSTSKFTSISIKPVSKQLEFVKIRAEVKIYDVGGNVLADTVINRLSENQQIEFKWNGRTKTGRIVGAGTYVAIVKATDENPENNAKPLIRKVLIGVWNKDME